MSQVFYQLKHSSLASCYAKLAYLIISILYVAIPQFVLVPQASALPQDQVDTFKSGVDYFNIEACNGATTTSTGSLPSMIPEPYNGAFTQGGNNHRVAPALVAAIFTEENFTHSPPNQLAAIWAGFPKKHPDPNSGWPTSSAGATGPFQFLPSTWTGLGYHIGDINNLTIAADAAAKYLAQNGGTTDKPPSSWDKAIFAYNHAQWYVDAVMAYYNFYTSGGTNTNVNTTASAVVTVSCAGGGSTGTVQCTGTQPSSGQNGSSPGDKAACIAKQELALWKAGKMRPGFRSCAPNDASCSSYSKYSQNTVEFWCADFVSWVYEQAGHPIVTGAGPGVWRTAAVENIYQIGRTSSHWQYHPATGYSPHIGDLAIHYDSQLTQPFAHVNMVVATNGKGWTTIGGDQGNGAAPNGTVVSGYPVSGPSADPPTIIGFVSPK